MKGILVFLTLMVAAMGVACAAVSTPLPNATDSGGSVPAITLITPESHGYPAPAGWNAYPIEAILPTGYPGIIAVAPSGEVDLGLFPPATPGLAEQEMPPPGRPGVPDSPELTRLIEAIKADLGVYTGLDVKEIEYSSVTPVVWPNDGLGCPPAGVDYPELQVEGLLVRVFAAGELYTYHTEGLSRFVNCRDGQPVSGGSIAGS